MKTLVDSNILIYSLTKEAQKRVKSQNFIRTNRTILCLSHQVVLESLRVLTHPKFKHPVNYKDALRSVSGIADKLSVISPNYETIIVFYELMAKYKLVSNHIFDAYLVATAITNDVELIATDNSKHFKIYQEIKIVDPFEGNQS